MSELNKRIFTSLVLFLLLFLCFKSNLVLFILLIFVTFEIFFEFAHGGAPRKNETSWTVPGCLMFVARPHFFFWSFDEVCILRSVFLLMTYKFSSFLILGFFLKLLCWHFQCGAKRYFGQFCKISLILHRCIFQIFVFSVFLVFLEVVVLRFSKQCKTLYWTI